MIGWLQRAGKFRVEHVPCPHPGLAVDFDHGPFRGCQHTTEGGLEAALAKFLQIDAPHFLIGSDRGRVRVLQLIPLGWAAAALEHPAGTPATNGAVHAQIELADFSQHHPWLPQPFAVQQALSALYAALHQVARIPLAHVSNPSRSRTVFASHGGWYGHADIPDQPSGHWDPGMLDYRALFPGIILQPKPVVKPAPKPIVLHPRTYTLVRRANGLVYAESLERPT